MVPRHEQIVATILGDEHAYIVTKAIGIAEILMALWIVSGIKPRLNVIVQIVVIGTMNIIEFVFVPDLLLWGRFNLLFALLLIALIYWNDLQFRKKVIQPL